MVLRLEQHKLVVLGQQTLVLLERERQRLALIKLELKHDEQQRLELGLQPLLVELLA